MVISHFSQPVSITPGQMCQAQLNQCLTCLPLLITHTALFFNKSFIASCQQYIAVIHEDFKQSYSYYWIQSNKLWVRL